MSVAPDNFDTSGLRNPGPTIHGVTAGFADDLTPADKAALVKTVAGEGANQPALAQQYIASTILNRAKLSGKSVADIASDSKQYEGADNKVAKSATPGSDLHSKVLSNIGPVLENGPISSVTHFVNPTLQAADGRKYPAWGNGGDGVKVGDQIYFDRSEDIAKNTKGSPSDSDFVNAANGNAAPTTTSGPSDQDFVNAANTQSTTTPAQPQSPAYTDMTTKSAAINAALNKQFPNGTTANPNSAPNALSAGIIQGLTANTVPLIGGALAGLHTGINNFMAKHFGVGTPTSYGMGDAFSAARKIGDKQLNDAAAAHPVLNAVGNTAGFIASPVLKGLGAATAPARAALATTGGAGAVAGRIGLSALEAGGAGAAAGAGQAASDGGTPSQIGESALTYGVPSALGGAAGEALAPVLTKGAAALAGHNAHPAAQVAARVAAHALGGAAVGGGLGYLTGGAKGGELGAAMGAGFGSTGGIREATPVKSYSPEHAQIATEHLAKTISPNLEEAAKHFESSPHHTTAEATGEHAPKLLTTATQSNSNSVGNLKTAVADRQNQTEVKKNLISAVNKIVGGDVEPGNIIRGVADDVAKTTNIHPAEAEMNVGDYLENKRKTVNADLWSKVDNSSPVNTEEHNKLLHEEPVVRTALAQAQRDLGPEGLTANPNLKTGPSTYEKVKTDESVAKQKANNIYSDLDKTEVGKSAQQSFENILDYVKNDPNLNEIYSKGGFKALEGQTPRLNELLNKYKTDQNKVFNIASKPIIDAYQKNLPTGWTARRSAFEDNYNEDYDKDIYIHDSKGNRIANISNLNENDWNNISKNIPPIKAANNLNGEDISEYFKNGPVAGRNFSQIHPQEIADYHNNKNGVSNEPETVPTQKAWIKAERYLGRSVPRNAFGKIDYSNPRTIEIQNSQQDVNAANKQHFEGLTEAKAASGEDFSFERAKDLGNKLSTTKTSESPEAFAKRYTNLSDPEKEATQHGYLEEFYRKLRNDPNSAANEYSKDIHQNFQKTMFGEEGANTFQGALYKAKLAKAINNLNANGGAVEEKHLKELNNFVTDENERATQDKIFGKEKAEQLRAAITKQVDAAKSAGDISKFSATSKGAEKDHDTVQAGALGFVSHGLHGALKGIGITSALKSTGHVLEAIKQGHMTPEAQQALADKLAQSPQQTAQDIRNLKARKENMPMSKSTIIPKASKGAFTGLGYLTGRTTHNAFTGQHN